MAKILNFLLLIFFYEKCNCAVIYEDTELLLAFLVFRHGDRTVLTSSLAYTTDPEKVHKLSEVYGFGELTDVGLKRSFEVGNFIRERYNTFLLPKYNKSEIYIRSTDFTRTEMSILAASAALYSPGSPKWNPALNWSPTPYTTAPTNIDYNLASINCPIFKQYYNTMMDYNASEMATFSNLFEELAKFWYDFRKTPVRILEGFDTLLAQRGLGVPLDPKLEKVFLEVQEAASKAWDLVFGKEKFLNVLSGVLLKSFLNSCDKAIAGEPTQKVRILSGHDFNVYPFLRATQAVPTPGVPKFGSLYGLELRRVLKTGSFIVMPYYVEQPGEELQYLEINGCGEELCDIEKFKRLTAKYVLSENEWRTRCNITNADVDVSVLN